MRLTADTSSDFYIGVKTRLIDKTHCPEWNRMCLADISDDLVRSYFEPLPPNEELQLPVMDSSFFNNASPCTAVCSGIKTRRPSRL